jgi:hypothetical protein
MDINNPTPEEFFAYVEQNPHLLEDPDMATTYHQVKQHLDAKKVGQAASSEASSHGPKVRMWGDVDVTTSVQSAPNSSYRLSAFPTGITPHPNPMDADQALIGSTALQKFSAFIMGSRSPEARIQHDIDESRIEANKLAQEAKIKALATKIQASLDILKYETQTAVNLRMTEIDIKDLSDREQLIGQAGEAAVRMQQSLSQTCENLPNFASLAFERGYQSLLSNVIISVMKTSRNP